MNLTRSSTIRLIRLFTFALIAVLIIAYAIWRSLNYARGPSIKLFTPADGSGISSSTVTVTGQALRTSSLSLNEDTLSVDEHGNFNQTVIVFPGVNILTLTAHDQFGRSIQKKLEIVGMTSFTQAQIPASTSTSSSAASTTTN